MSLSTAIKRLLIGPPFPNRMEIHERLDKVRGLAVFASDPISSNAYATEAIMSILVLLGTGALHLTLPIALGIAGLVSLVVFSYIQTIFHYPEGGGAYFVTKDNLGKFPSLTAAAALLIDYTLTVAVSVSAGVRAVTSAFPEVWPYRLALALVVIAFITWMNLRGVRESGTVFAIPTYAFVAGVLTVIAIGMARYFGLFGLPSLPTGGFEGEAAAAVGDVSQALFIWLLLRAFAAGCTALTGIEAIADGVKAFKPPEALNAAKTMLAMAVIAMSLFLGISFLSTTMALIPVEENSILSQMTYAITGGGFLYYWVQIFTAGILFLAANTGYQDFPRVSAFLARDNFLPRWLQNRGDRLVYSAGIVTLAILASLVVVIFRADEIAMLPLYALGVMLCFSLSQAGMARLMYRIGRLKPGETVFTGVTHVHYEPNWWWKFGINSLGSIVTSIVLVILIATKFIDGAWIVVLAIPTIVFMFATIERHYRRVADALRPQDLAPSDLKETANVVIVPIADIHRGTLRAIDYAERIAPDDVRVVHIVTSEESRERILRRWERFKQFVGNAKLILIDYEYRDILEPLIDYIIEVNDVEFHDKLVTVVVPQFVSRTLVEDMLHNQTAARLRSRLRDYTDLVIIDIPYHIG
ncbi:MAG: APC family permease [Anaerolineae bacterium]